MTQRHSVVAPELHPAPVSPSLFARLMRKRFCAGIAAAWLLAVSPISAAAAQTIGTGPTSGTVGGGFGIFGQTFTTPNETPNLTDFSFWIGSPYYGEGYDYQLKLYVFNGSEPVGSALFTSAVATAQAGSAITQQTFSTGGLALTAGQTYMALIQRANSGGIWMGFSGQGVDAYSGGQFYTVTGSATDPTAVSYIHAFDNAGSDLAFTAAFSQVSSTPEPGTLTLVGTGLIGLFGAVRRRTVAGAALDRV